MAVLYIQIASGEKFQDECHHNLLCSRWYHLGYRYAKPAVIFKSIFGHFYFFLDKLLIPVFSLVFYYIYPFHLKKFF